MTKFIAEIGWNHMGDMDLAKKMILAAKENGADYVKTQIFDIKFLKDGPWMEDGRKEIYEKSQLSDEKYLELLEYSKKIGINFFTSIFNTDAAKRVNKFQKDIIKIPSTESRNKELIKYCNDNFDKVLISTGTSSENELIEIKNNLNKSNYIFLHCVSAYPCDPKIANLKRINFIKKLSKEYGYSDHTPGIEIAKMSLEFDINFLEKHFTLDNSLPGRDNKFAILPEDLKNFKDYLNDREKAHIFHGNDFLKEEEEARNIYTGRWG